ncbi:MAG: helix-turn-helix domain-containing protein [Pirellula sp.]
MHVSDIQSHFFKKLADPAGIRAIFEYLTNVAFFVKDRQGKIITVSSSVLNRLGMTRETEFVGKTDAEVYSTEMAEAFRKDDEKVFLTGTPLVNRLEVWLDEKGQPDWCVTTKVPLFGVDGSVVGLMGVSRRDLNLSVLEPEDTPTKAIAYLRQNIDRNVSTEELAEAISVSPRTLNRKIQQAFGTSPYELILRIRIQAAAESLLKCADSISSVAISHGFCDQSHFTQHFRNRMGMTPRKFRAMHQMVKEK